MEIVQQKLFLNQSLAIHLSILMRRANILFTATIQLVQVSLSMYRKCCSEHCTERVIPIHTHKKKTNDEFLYLLPKYKFLRAKTPQRSKLVLSRGK